MYQSLFMIRFCTLMRLKTLMRMVSNRLLNNYEKVLGGDFVYIRVLNRTYQGVLH